MPPRVVAWPGHLAMPMPIRPAAPGRAVAVTRKLADARYGGTDALASHCSLPSSSETYPSAYHCSTRATVRDGTTRVSRAKVPSVMDSHHRAAGRHAPTPSSRQKVRRRCRKKPYPRKGERACRANLRIPSFGSIGRWAALGRSLPGAPGRRPVFSESGLWQEATTAPQERGRRAACVGGT